MKKRKRIFIFSLFGLAFAFLIAYRVLNVVPDLNPRHRLHWMVYGYDRVWYHNRTYIYPNSKAISEIEAGYGKLYPTGENVIGLPVISPKEALNTPFDRTVLFLKKSDKQCIVYVLSGGP